jgi:cytochrome P450
VSTSTPTAIPVPAPPDGPTKVSLLTTITTRLSLNTPLIRALSWPILRLRPTLVTKARVIVTRHADVLEVLDRDEDFTVAEVNADRMALVNGPFVLGLDRSPLLLREQGLLQRAVQPGDLDRIRTSVQGHARDLVEAALPAGRIDVVQGLARPAATRLVDDYFGVAGPDEATMMHWMRTIFYETFLNVGNDKAVRAEGVRSGLALHRHMDEVIATRKAQVATGAPAPDDLLTRLVRMQADPGTALSDEGVRRNVGGVIVGAVDTTSKAVAHALDQLLLRPDHLQAAQAAALAGDIERVAAFAFEALRFNPINPILARHVARDTTLAAGTKWERRLPAGRTVYVGILPAMFDPRVFERPGDFRVDRDPGSYVHFGAGLHTCYGRHVNLIQIPELLAALLRLGSLRRAGGPSGSIRYDGPFPDQFVVEFDGGG